MGATDKRIAALDWAARGFRVFRLSPGTKIPPKGSRWTEEATSDPDTIENWWRSTPDANIGVLCDGLCVVDIDVKGEKPGIQTYRDLGLSQDTLVVKTPTGGFHVYFKGDAPNTAGRLGPGVDTRGFHGYVLAPGSETPEGAYVLVRDRPVCAAPDALAARLGSVGDRPEGAKRSPAAVLDTPEAVAFAIAYLQDDAPLAVEGDNGDDTTFKVAAHLKDEGLTAQTTFNLMSAWWNSRCLPPWDLDDLRVKINNAYHYGREAPGSNRPEVAFKGVMVEGEITDSPYEWAGDAWDSDAEWLLCDTLPASGVAMLIAPTQAGKTFLLGHVARCIALNEPFFGITPDRTGATVFLTGGGEGSGFKQRMSLVQGRPPICHRQILPLNIAGRLDALLEDLKALSLQTFNEHGVPLRLVVFETLSSIGLLDKENDNALAAVAINAFSRVARELGVLVLFSHHTPKGGGGARGAGAIEANVDFAWEITRVGDVRDLAITKARNAPQRNIGSFTLPTVAIGQDSRGRQVTTCVVSESIGPSASHKAKTAAFSELFMECLDIELGGETFEIEGVETVTEKQVRDLFKLRKKGSKDPSNVNSAFRDARNFCVDNGAAKLITVAGEKYLIKNEIGD